MQPHEQALFLTAISEFVQEQVAKAVAAATTPLLMKIEELQGAVAARPIIEDVVERTFDSVMKNLSSIKYARTDELSQIIEHERAQTGEALMRFADLLKQTEDKIAALPIPKDGKDGASVHMSDVLSQFNTLFETAFNSHSAKIDERLASVKDGKDGTNVDMDQVADVIQNSVAAYVKEALAEWPKPKDGKDGRDGADGKDGRDGSDGHDVDVDSVNSFIISSVHDAVAALPVPPVPVHVVGGYVDRDGNLCLTLSDGGIKTLGLVVGRDGKDADPELVRKTIEDLFASVPKPKDGKDGVDLTHASITSVGDRNFILHFSNEAKDKQINLEFSLPAQINKGFWNEETLYKLGDLVTYGGSQWCCMVQETKMRPETGDGNDWHLSVKRGRDGKQGTPGPKGEKGIDGRDGRDLTQLGFDGSKS